MDTNKHECFQVGAVHPNRPRRLRSIAPTFVTFAAFCLISSASASQENPTKEELLQTVRHIGQLAKETQAELDKEKAAHASALDSLGTLQSQVDSLAKSAAESQTRLSASQAAIWRRNAIIIGETALIAIGVFIVLKFPAFL